jgi:hypothetical protein
MGRRQAFLIITVRTAPADKLVRGALDRCRQRVTAAQHEHIAGTDEVSIPPPAKTEIDVPRGSVWLLQPGVYDIDSGGPDQPTRITVFEGSARFILVQLPQVKIDAPCVSTICMTWSRRSAKLSCAWYDKSMEPAPTRISARDCGSVISHAPAATGKFTWLPTNRCHRVRKRRACQTPDSRVRRGRAGSPDRGDNPPNQPTACSTYQPDPVSVYISTRPS